MSLISWSLHNFSQPDFLPHMSLTHIYVLHSSHNLQKNLQAYNIEGTVKQEKEHNFQRASKGLGIVRQLNELYTIPSQTFTMYSSHNKLSGMQLTSSKRNQ